MVDQFQYYLYDVENQINVYPRKCYCIYKDNQVSRF